MRQEWIERMHDQARTEMGYCVQDGRIWCSSHDSGKVPGAESCNKMDEGYRIAESAGEVVEELALADLRAMVEALRDIAAREFEQSDYCDYEAHAREVAYAAVLALFKEVPE